MAAVVVFAVFVRAVQEAEWYRQLRSRHAAALRDYKAAMLWYDEGRLDLVRGVLASERLLEAELGLSATGKDQATAISAHVERAGYMIEAERNEPFGLCEHPMNRNMRIGEAEDTLVRWRTRLKTMRGIR
jgi:hypothetical protein